MITFRNFLASSLIAVSALANTAQTAQANLLTNAGFEAAGPNLAAGGSYCYLGYAPLDCGTVPSWSGTPQVIASNSGPWGDPSTNGGWTAAQGDRLAGLQNASYMQQTLTLAAGGYLLTWLDSNRKNYGSGNDYQVQLDGGSLGLFNTIPGDAWAGNSLSFTVAAAGSHTLRFQGMGISVDGTAFVDDLRLTAAVPEPQSLAMVLLGLAVVGAMPRRKSVR